MPVYNAEGVIKSAIDSVLRQRGPSFEFLIIDDGSSDSTPSIIKSYTDPRIRFIEQKLNIGVASTLNHGLDLSVGKYILRMDSDDICFPSRFSKQFNFMEQNPEIGISGTWIRLFGDQPPVIERSPVGRDVVKAYLFFGSPMFHPTVIMRRELLEKFNLRYDPGFNRTEDYDLWSRAADCFPLENIPEPQLKFRCHASSVTSIANDTMYDQTILLMRRSLEKVGVTTTREEIEFHYAVSKGKRMGSLEEIKKAGEWLENLIEKNKKSKYCPDEACKKAAGLVFFRLCAHSAQLGISAMEKYFDSSLSAFFNPQLGERFRFYLSIFYNKFFFLDK